MARAVTNLLMKRIVHFSVKRQLHKSPEIRIVEVGPRDGLQNEPKIVPTDVKIEFINRLSKTGLGSIEVTSFVSPKWVPQMADNVKVFESIQKDPNIGYPVLIPNLEGLKLALTVGVKELAVFASASEGFARKNTNCSVQEGLERIKTVTEAAKLHNLRIRGYVSCVVGCPYDGFTKPVAVAKVAETLLELGCYEISLGDTIGVGTKTSIQNMFKEVLKVSKPNKLAVHCHDTYGQALSNICFALDLGVQVADSSVSGLGGCPYAKGATGNVATEDLVYMLQGFGVETGVDLRKLISVGQFISKVLDKPTGSKVNAAMYSKLA